MTASDAAAESQTSVAAPAPVEPTTTSRGLAAVVFAGGMALPRVVNLGLLPLYTSVLDPSEYGRLSLLLAIGVALQFLYSMGLDTALVRGYFETREVESQTRYVNSVWVASAGLIPLIAGLCVVCAAVAASAIDVVSFEEITLTIVAYAVYAAAIPVPLAALRSGMRLRGFAILTGTSTALNTAAILVFVTVLDGGVSGWLLGVLVANVLTLPVAALVVPFRPPAPFLSSRVAKSLRLGIPLIPHYMAQWALQLADRAVLAGLVSAAQLGVYGLAANVSVPALVAVQAVSQALMPSYARVAGVSLEQTDVSSTIRTHVVAVLVITCSLALVLPPLCVLVTPDVYSSAADIVPWLVLGYGLLGLYYVPMNVLTLVYGRSQFVWIITVVAAAVSLGSLALLVPVAGLTFAGVASALGYGVLLGGVSIYTFRMGRRYEGSVNVPWRAIGAWGLGVGAYFAAVTLALPAESVSGFVLRSVAVGVGLILVAWLLAGQAIRERLTSARRTRGAGAS